MIAIIFTVICNLGSLVAFTILALHFDKWWIILFALLFYREIKVARIRSEEYKNDEV